VILLYDNDEKIAPAAATTLVQRGYDNIFMLSGGEYFTLYVTGKKDFVMGLLHVHLCNFYCSCGHDLFSHHASCLLMHSNANCSWLLHLYTN